MVSAVILFMRSFMRSPSRVMILSVSLSFLFSFFSVKDQIASLQLKQIVVCSVCVFISLRRDCDRF